MTHILIVEDEPSIAESLVFVLAAEGFGTHWETLASSALAYVGQHQVDLVVMDIGLPDMSGIEACKLLRKHSEVPVIFLTARGSELDRVLGLEIGADDYVVKPFSPRELAARVKAILKRVRPLTIASAGTTLATDISDAGPIPEFVVDVERKTIHYRQQLLNLTRLEFGLLCTLVSQPERVYSREQLLNSLGISTEAGYDRSIDTHIKTLRAKLRVVSPEAEPIKTLRGFGYAYQPER